MPHASSAALSKQLDEKEVELAQQRRGEYVDMKFLTDKRVAIKYDLPLAEVITDFFDVMKSRSKGYASMEYSVIDYRPHDLVRLDVRINGAAWVEHALGGEGHPGPASWARGPGGRPRGAGWRRLHRAGHRVPRGPARLRSAAPRRQR